MGAPDQLLEDLRSADEEGRRAALSALTLRPDLRALPDLRWIQSSDESDELRFLAKRAILVLAGVSPDGAAPPRVPPLDDPDPRRRILAIYARAARAGAQDVEALQGRIAVERDPTVRPQLALALGASGDRTQIAALEPLLDEPDPDVRHAALQSLSLLRDATAYPYFVRFARDGDDRLRALALAQLALLGREKVVKLCEVMARAQRPWMVAAGIAVLSSLKDARHLPLFAQHLAHEDPAVRARARESLERLAAEGHAAARDALAGAAAAAARAAAAPPLELPESGPEQLRSPEPATRLAYVQAVLTRRDTEAIPALISRLERETDMRVLAMLVTVLGQMGDTTAVDGLREFLASPNDRVRANAVEAIGRLAPPTERGLLVRSLDDPHNRVRTNAILALWGTGPTGVRDALSALKNSNDRKSRLSAIYAIGQIGEPAAGLLNDLLDDTDREVAQRARECWRMLGLEDASGSALPAKEMPDRQVESASATALPTNPAALAARTKELEAARETALREIADGYMERVGKSLVAPPEMAPAMSDVTAARQKFKHNKPETRAAFVDKQIMLARAVISNGLWDDDEFAALRDRLEQAESQLAQIQERKAAASPKSRKGFLIAIAVAVGLILLVGSYFALNME